MAQKTLVMGESGTGKSTSLRNLDPAITAIVNPVGKPLPFKSKNGKFTMLNNETKSSNITAWMKGQAKAGKKILIVDVAGLRFIVQHCELAILDRKSVV